ncbi:uncharacterized protein H6S33_011287 [Morchella sextelata]|uniref:uncharacterized protein n=1 Tax=Morchella sextelata TaxID=1174677 RepID=UPI001D038E93|nr:uncharacterized protein H6S33_011287 [Morchella sextelata]KAH0610860.1 hypothetical protein H6S33_011287 [Morchella sextelata]
MSVVTDLVFALLKREAEEPDTEEPTDPGESEIISSWALFIQVSLLILALFCSYYLQLKKIQAVHETVVSIFAGMFVGLLIRVTPGDNIQNLVKFDYQIFFNVLLPPIILNSGYELHQANFFRNIGSILTFAFAGTFISAVVLGTIVFIWSWGPLETLDISYVEAIAVGATLSATDPVTILAIFNTYKVDPKLYTVIFGESILNDAVAIVMFETAQRFHGAGHGPASVGSLFKGIGIFFIVFTVRIVSLLFCGITLKHYAYYNMSRRTQLTTKYLFQVLAQLSENFIFIYLGLSLFTDTQLVFRPLFILVTTIGICVARWAAVFPLSKLINFVIRSRARARGQTAADELPHSYQAMLFWAGLRGAVGVALAAGITGENGNPLRATVLVVVVLTVIVFGGTTARMLEILGIRTGVVEEIDSDDEFDIETVGPYFKSPRGGMGPNSVPLSNVDSGIYASGQRGISPDTQDTPLGRRGRREPELLRTDSNDSDADSDIDDLPPMIPTTVRPRGASITRTASASGNGEGSSTQAQTQTQAASIGITAGSAFNSLTGIFSGTSDDQAEWFRKLDEGYIKPTLLLDPGKGNGGGNGYRGPGAV